MSAIRLTMGMVTFPWLSDYLGGMASNPPIPASPAASAPAALTRLLEIMARLRDPATGCPWDIEQDFASIAPYTIEVADAIARGNWSELEAELGDLLLQVVYHARLGEEAGLFDFASIARTISSKMIDRHPHVFGSERSDRSAAEQTADWEARKAAERGPAGTLDGIALALPALTRAVKLQKRAARVGFDWPDAGQVLAKIVEEAHELAEARESLAAEEIEEEFGDLLFVLANLARHLHVDPETALRGANRKFARRFASIEAALAAEGRSPQDSTLAEMDALWDAAKAAERS